MQEEELVNEQEMSTSPQEKGEETAQNEENCCNELQTLIVKKDEEITALQDKFLRQAAEFDNYRKRTIKEKADLIKTASEKVIVDILPVLDDFERALQNIKKADSDPTLLEGVELIYQKFVKVLEHEGLQKIDTDNVPFDTDYHEAIAMIPAPTEEQKGKVIDCAKTGYTLNDKVIRHAQVAVGE